ncbi:MAG TPA: diacylglycerol kinase family protein [Lentimicrobium sp.]|nr:diacylglycerol kinase family protein [Lentimicrobium sp.]
MSIKAVLQKRLKSFTYAFNGMRVLFKEEPNAKIHTILAIAALVTGVLTGLSEIEWIALIIAIGFVIAFEAINTAVENLCDLISPGQNESIKKIKDLAAAAVLLSAICALLIGLIIFVPKLLE